MGGTLFFFLGNQGEELSSHLLDLGSPQTIFTTEKKRYSIGNQLNVEEGVGSGNAWCGKLLFFVLNLEILFEF